MTGGSARRTRSFDRRHEPLDLDPYAVLERVPARSLMERLSIPLLAVGDGGRVILANDAFAALIGYPLPDLTEVPCDRLFRDAASGDSMLCFIADRAEQVVVLDHSDGHAVHAKLSRSVLMRRDETAALVAFTDVTELRWTEGRDR